MPPAAGRGDALWAVAPLANESGFLGVDPVIVSDQVVAAVEEVRGLRAVPMNRTLDAMQRLGISRITTPAEARLVSQALGVDGLIVGSITAYDPYQPVLGLSLALFDPTESPDGAAIDPRALTLRAAEAPSPPRSRFQGMPRASVSEIYDAKNHQVLMDVRQFAQGRTDPVSAIGWRRYTKSMDLFTQFAAARAVGSLVESEWIRAGQPMAAAPKRTP